MIHHAPISADWRPPSTATKPGRAPPQARHRRHLPQTAACEAFAGRGGIAIIETFTDVASGATGLSKRPGLADALTAMREHGAGVLLVARRDRLGRDVALVATLEAGLRRHGGRVLAAQGAPNDDTPEAKLMRRLIDAISEYERSLIQARTRAALRAKRRRGEVCGGTPRCGHSVATNGRTCTVDPPGGRDHRAHRLDGATGAQPASDRRAAQHRWRARAGQALVPDYGPPTVATACYVIVVSDDDPPYPATFEAVVELARRALHAFDTGEHVDAVRVELALLQPYDGLEHLGLVGRELAATLRKASNSKDPRVRSDLLIDAWARASQHVRR